MFTLDHTNRPLKTEADVRAWIESVDEAGTQPADIADELAQAWRIVYGRELADEDADTRRDAWSLLCADVV